MGAIDVPKTLCEFECSSRERPGEKFPLRFCDSRFVRGFFGRTYAPLHEFHQHSPFGDMYRHPVVQYKVVDGNIMVVGLQNGSFMLERVELPDIMRLGSEYRFVERQTRSTQQEKFGIASKQKRYRFLTPWLALNHKNRRTFFQLEDAGEDSSGLFARMLIGNLLSMSQTFFYDVPGRLEATCNVRYIKQFYVKENEPWPGFQGEFSVNFHIPDYWGIGKSPSLGYGTVLSMPPEEEEV